MFPKKLKTAMPLLPWQLVSMETVPCCFASLYTKNKVSKYETWSKSVTIDFCLCTGPVIMILIYLKKKPSKIMIGVENWAWEQNMPDIMKMSINIKVTSYELYHFKKGVAWSQTPPPFHLHHCQNRDYITSYINNYCNLYVWTNPNSSAQLDNSSEQMTYHPNK